MWICVLFFKMIPNSFRLKGTKYTILLMNFLYCCRISNNFNHSNIILCRNSFIWLHSEILTCIQPNFIHNFYQLQCQHILSDIITIFKYNLYYFVILIFLLLLRTSNQLLLLITLKLNGNTISILFNLLNGSFLFGFLVSIWFHS